MDNLILQAAAIVRAKQCIARRLKLPLGSKDQELGQQALVDRRTGG